MNSTDRHYRNYLPACARLTWWGCVAILLAIGYGTLTVASAEDARLENLQQAEPLAEVEIQQLPSAEPAPATAANPLVLSTRMAEDDPLSYYARTEDGLWAIPEHVDPADPWVRLLVLAPSRPVIVDLAVHVEGKPFRAVREQLIDSLIAEAKTTALVREGASTAEAVLEEPSAEAPEKQAAEEEASLVKARDRQNRSVVQRLINYLAAAETEATREEVRWLLSEWTGGPALLVLGPAITWQRALEAPLWGCLNTDGDHRLSAEEIENAAQRLQEADFDENGVIERGELHRSSTSHTLEKIRTGFPLVVVLENETNWRDLGDYLRTAYGSSNASGSPSEGMPDSLRNRIVRGDPSLSERELMGLATTPADITCCVRFGDKESTFQLLELSTTTGKPLQLSAAEETVIAVDIEQDYLELSAAHQEQADSRAMQQTQVAVGAVVDGSPLLRLLDSDNDRRLTRRERLKLDGALKRLDRNQDSAIDMEELPIAIRLAVTRGPRLHEHLKDPTSAIEGSQETAPSPEAPPWFTGMDRNGDGDLSRSEFQGTSEQFSQLDTDGDQLISVKEAQ